MSKSYNYKGFRIEILYEDNDIAILNKPSGLLTHKKNEYDTSPSLQESLKDQFIIKNNENYTGVSVFFVDEGIDSGPIIVQKKIEIGNKSQKDLIFTTKKVGMECISKAIDIIEKGNYKLI